MSALQDELRKKYKTPQEAATALGIDPALVADAALTTDPPVSEAQRRAMYAAAEGKSTLGIPKKVGKEFVGKDAPMKRAEDKKAMDKFPKSALDWMSKNMSKDAFDEFCAKDEWPDEAEDEAESEPDEETESKAAKAKASEKEDKKESVGKDKKAKDKAMDKKAMDGKKAMDKKAKDEEEEVEEINEGEKNVKQHAEDGRQAMDEAIKASGKAIEKAVHAKFQGLYAAAEAVRPYIGEVSPMTFDSGDALKIHALEKLGVKDANKLSGAALDIVLGYQRKAGAHPIEHTGTREAAMTMDEASRKSACELVPGLDRIIIGV